MKLVQHVRFLHLLRIYVSLFLCFMCMFYFDKHHVRHKTCYLAWFALWTDAALVDCCPSGCRTQP
jgi:hypothetical protein